jgi:hypothetical protein
MAKVFDPRAVQHAGDVDDVSAGINSIEDRVWVPDERKAIDKRLVGRAAM